MREFELWIDDGVSYDYVLDTTIDAETAPDAEVQAREWLEDDVLTYWYWYLLENLGPHDAVKKFSPKFPEWQKSGFTPDAVFDLLQGGGSMDKLGDYEIPFSWYTAGIVSDLYEEYIKSRRKGEFFETELGSHLVDCVTTWDGYLSTGNRASTWYCQAQWEVFQLALKQFLGVEYHFTRTDGYFGICTEDESDWLFKVER